MASAPAPGVSEFAIGGDGTVWAATHHAIAHVGPYSFTACYARDGGKERIPT